MDHVEFGYYVGNAKEVPLVTTSKSGRPRLIHPSEPLPDLDLPLRVKNDRDSDESIVLARALIREEKGSDVNVAANLLVDALEDAVDAAMVISNDSDLALPVRIARARVSVGTVNPSPRQVAGALRGQATDGVGRHWWRKLACGDFTANQLPNPVGGLARPREW